MASFTPSFLIYGATGQTGQLVVDALLARGLKPVLGGRDDARVKAMAEARGLRHRAFELDDRNALDHGISGFRLVVNLAGPFVGTSTALAQACLRVGAHYADISSELSDYRMLQPLADRAVDAGVMLLPGIGYGFMASDCLAYHAWQRHRTAVVMQIGMRSSHSGVTRGMMKTLLENPTLSGFRLEAGQLKPTSAFENVAEFDFGDGGRRRCANYPWRAEPLAVMAGTGISTVETYIELPRLIRLLTRYPALARNRRVRRLLLGAARGPTAKQLEQGRSWCVAQTIDENGRRHSSLLSGPDGYRFTAQTVSYAVEQVLGGRLQEGLVTPAQLFGTDPLHAIPGLTLIDR
jgi:short subunit dehydrogenase-like uncharacterized protein